MGLSRGAELRETRGHTEGGEGGHVGRVRRGAGGGVEAVDGELGAARVRLVPRALAASGRQLREQRLHVLLVGRRRLGQLGRHGRVHRAALLALWLALVRRCRRSSARRKRRRRKVAHGRHLIRGGRGRVGTRGSSVGRRRTHQHRGHWLRSRSRSGCGSGSGSESGSGSGQRQGMRIRGHEGRRRVRALMGRHWQRQRGSE